jgi:hypothetical protein
VLEQNKTADWRVLLSQTKLESENSAVNSGFEVSEELTSLTL